MACQNSATLTLRKSPVRPDPHPTHQLSSPLECWPGLHSGVPPSGLFSTLTGYMAALKNVFTYGPLRTVAAGDGEQTGGPDCAERERERERNLGFRLSTTELSFYRPSVKHYGPGPGPQLNNSAPPTHGMYREDRFCLK